MDNKPKSISEKLKFYRDACALSQQQVADALKMDRSNYSKYETGVTEPNLVTLVKIARIFNVTPLELLPESGADVRLTRQVRDSAGADSPIYQLRKDERSLIAKYRVLSDDDKLKAQELVGNLAKKDDNPPSK